MVEERAIVKAIESGIPLDTERPFLSLAEKVNIPEPVLLEEIRRLVEEKKIKRFGAVINNRKMGFDQNAMVTLNLPEEKIEETGKKIAEYDFVTLCYQRSPVKGIWEYNLYFMIHGNDRAVVENQIKKVFSEQNINPDQSEVLFSVRSFKQKGASY